MMYEGGWWGWLLSGLGFGYTQNVSRSHLNIHCLFKKRLRCGQREEEVRTIRSNYFLFQGNNNHSHTIVTVLLHSPKRQEESTPSELDKIHFYDTSLEVSQSRTLKLLFCEWGLVSFPLPTKERHRFEVKYLKYSNKPRGILLHKLRYDVLQAFTGASYHDVTLCGF